MRFLFARQLWAVMVLGTIGLISTMARADDFRLESASLPAPLLENGKVNSVIEASGIEPIGDGRLLLLAHDKHPALFVMEAATGRLIGEPITSPRFPAPSKLGAPKWEGMARDGEGNYYIIGAHVGKTDEERASKSVLLRFRLKDGEPLSIDDATVTRWDSSRSLESGLKNQGLGASEVAKRKIEGLAIRESKAAGGSVRRELVIGLREPSDKVRAFVVDISTSPSPDADIELGPLFAFEAEPREGVTSQLTSLEYVQPLGGFLVVTATEDKGNAFHGNTLYFVPDGETSRAQKIAVFEVAMKAEGLAVLGVEKDPNRTTVKLLITYDNDPHATKIPSRFQTVALVREAH
jgi:hypothetical protein